MIRKEPTGFLDPALIAWQPEAGIPGLYAKTLSRCGATGSYTRLLKFLPGTTTEAAGVQSHDHLEELWIVSGAIFDLSLQQNFVKDMYANRLHHMDHGPWRAPDGAVTFELRDMDAAQELKKDQLEFFDPELTDWDGVDEDAGVFVKTLSRCADTGSYGRIVRFHPDARSTVLEGAHERSELWIVDGLLTNRDTGESHPAGHYGNLDVDLLGGSWTSTTGCTVFEVRNRI